MNLIEFLLPGEQAEVTLTTESTRGYGGGSILSYKWPLVSSTTHRLAAFIHAKSIFVYSITVKAVNETRDR